MRRTMVFGAVMAMLLAGCKGGGIFSAHTDTVAEAEGQQLSAQREADIMMAAKGMKPTPEAAEFVANIWVDLTLFSQTVAHDEKLTDSVTIAESMWPAILETMVTKWRDTLLARRANVSDATIDSAFKADQMRGVQHILVPADTASKEKMAAARKKLEGILARIRGGESFSKIARAESEDPGSVADSGYYPPAPKGKYVPSFDKVLWSMKPGDMSGIVATPYGFHIIRRPTEAESKRGWRFMLQQGSAEAVLQSYMNEVQAKYDVKVDKNAVARMRAAVLDLDGKRKDNSTVATYKGGSLTSADVVRWVKGRTTDPQQGTQLLGQIKVAPDSALESFAKALATNELMLKEAEENHIAITPAEWKVMVDEFSAAVDSVKATIGLTPAMLDPKLSKSERSKAVGVAVDKYFDALVSGAGVPLRLPPGMLAWTLRGRESFKIYPAGLKRVVDLAVAKRTADSAKANGIQPAPGGPPLPGGDTSKAGKVPPAGGGGTPPKQ